MFRRIRNLWKISDIDINFSDKESPVTTVKKTLGIKRMAIIVKDKPIDLFEDDKTD